MKISVNKVAFLSYELKDVNSGEIIEQFDNEHAQGFLFGNGLLLEEFEKQLSGLQTGDRFNINLSPDKAYGVHDPESVFEIDKDTFLIEGKIDESLFVIGHQIAMRDEYGNKHLGKVVAIHKDYILMDFNHPLAGKDLLFSGEVVGVRDATAEELNPSDGCGGSCDCGGHDHDHHHGHHHEGGDCQVCGNPPEMQGQGVGSCKCS